MVRKTFISGFFAIALKAVFYQNAQLHYEPGLNEKALFLKF